MSQTEYWLFNTDETEAAGKGKHAVMLRRGVVAAWGHCKGVGAEVTMNRAAPDDVIFYFRAGHGIIARAVADEFYSEPTNTIFGEDGEYSRAVKEIKVLPDTEPVRVADIKSKTGYQIPYRQIMARILDSSAVKLLDQRFRSVASAHGSPAVTSRRSTSGYFVIDPEERKRIEKAAVRLVSEIYADKEWHVKSVERENVGYDLHCVRSDKVECVEVKGTSGHEERFVLTANELNKAKSDERFVLYVVTNAVDAPKPHKYTGRQLLSQFEVEPTQYRAAKRRNGS